MDLCVVLVYGTLPSIGIILIEDKQMSGKIRVIKTFSDFHLNDGIDRLIDIFQRAKEATLKDENSEEAWTNLKVCYEVYDDCLEHCYISGERWETDAEHEWRLKQEKTNREIARKRNKTLKAEKEKYEREMYEQLKKKYGDK